MFEQPTVFILGAGASWHYGYPTGEELVKMVIAAAKKLKEFCELSKNKCDKKHIPQYISEIYKDNWDKAALDCQRLIDALEAVHPLVIDYFLSQNKDLQPIGKLMIAWVILECEAVFLYSKHNENRIELLKNSPDKEEQKRVAKGLVDAKKYNDNWYRFILHQLLNGLQSSEDLLSKSKKNNVTFISFNYDVSLETQLRNGLEKVQLLNETDINKAHVEEFFKNNLIIHVYGSIRDFQKNKDMASLTPDAVQKRLEVFTSIETTTKTDYGFPIKIPKEPILYKNLLDEVYEASQNIETIGVEKQENPIVNANAEKAQKLIEKAQVVYILGYGFDELNNNLLGLKENLSKNGLSINHQRNIMFTNFENSERINKRAGILFANKPNLFANGNVAFKQTVTTNFQYERSIKNVYEAFADDFDAI